MDIERLLLSKIIETGDFGPASETNMTAEWFSDPAAAKVWELIVEHKAKYGQVPSVGAVKRDYPTYKLLATDESMDYLVDEMRKHRQLVLQENAVTDAANLVIARKPHLITQRLHQVLADIARTEGGFTDINLALNGEERLRHYRELAELDGRLRGIPSGFPAIDRALGGYVNTNLITFVGPPKVGKSTGILLMCKAANEAGYEPMLVGFEMSNEEQYERLDAIRAGISHTNLRMGTLTPEEKKKLERAIKIQANLPDFYMTQDTSSVMTITGLRAKIEKFDPDIVFIDGVYMMEDEQGEPNNTPRALTNLTRGLKRLAQQLQKPIVISTQALESKMHGKSLSTYSIGYCVDDLTEALTKDRGWVRRQNLRPGDVILGLDHESGKSVWTPVLDVNVFPAMPRTMLSMETRTHSSLSTLEHRWPVVSDRRGVRYREWVTSGTLKYGKKIIQRAPYAGAPEEATLPDELVELVAWFWTEGSLHSYNSGTITQCADANPENVDRIRTCFEKLFGEPTPPGLGRASGPAWREYIRKDRNLHEFWFNKHLGEVLQKYAPNKVPTQEFLLSLTAEQLEIYIATAYEADGHNSAEAKGNALSQKDRRRSEMFQLALILAGRSTHIWEVQTKHGPLWQVSERGSETFSPAETQRLSPDNVKYVTYNGLVWCPTTGTGTWLARRNGHVYFTGNSSSFVQDSDAIIGVERTDDPHITKMKLLLARNAAGLEIFYKWCWEPTSFEELDYNPLDTGSVDFEEDAKTYGWASSF